MANFAHLSDSVVTNLIFANTLADAELVLGVGSCVEYTDKNPAAVGWTYDPETQTFSAPTEG
jgi:hypothetical protein